MAESTNIESIELNDLSKLLTNDEILESGFYLTLDTTFTPTPIFKDFGELLQTEKYNLRIIFRNGNDTSGRDYKFILRTYNEDFTIIDSYVLSSWIRRDNEYCFGQIDKNLRIEKTCSEGGKVEKYRLAESGKFEEF